LSREGKGGKPEPPEGVAGKGRMNIILAVAAGLILIGSLSVLIYMKINEEDTDSVTIDGKEYEWGGMFSYFETVDLDGHTGIPLTVLVEDAGTENPEEKKYEVRGSDGYIKTFTWEDLENGVLENEGKRAVFPDKERSFWVRNVVEIKVI
jgi:hypothetical protein